MYLLVFVDHRIRQIEDNLTVAEMLAIQERTLRVFQVIDGKFLEIVIDNGKLCLVPVPVGTIIQGKEGRFHQ